MFQIIQVSVFIGFMVIQFLVQAVSSISCDLGSFEQNGLYDDSYNNVMQVGCTDWGERHQNVIARTKRWEQIVVEDSGGADHVGAECLSDLSISFAISISCLSPISFNSRDWN